MLVYYECGHHFRYYRSRWMLIIKLLHKGISQIAVIKKKKYFQGQLQGYYYILGPGKKKSCSVINCYCTPNTNSINVKCDNIKYTVYNRYVCKNNKSIKCWKTTIVQTYFLDSVWNEKCNTYIGFIIMCFFSSYTCVITF